MRWGPADIKRAVSVALNAKKKAYAAIKKIKPEGRNFENIIYGIESAGYPIQDVAEKIDFLKSVSPEKAVRDAAQAALVGLERKLVDIEYDEELYRVVKAYAAKKEKLSGADKKLFDDMMRAYRRMGFELPKAKREQLKKNLKKLGELETKFRKNIDDHNDAITVTRQELEGLSESYIHSLEKDADGKYIVTLKYPHAVPFMENAVNASKRKELADKMNKKGGVRNVALLKTILSLRAQNAKLLGYANHAAFKVEVRMAKTADAVGRFIKRLLGKLRKGLDKELAMLTAAKRKVLGDTKAKLEYYDVAFYTEYTQKERYDVDGQKVREYFPLQTVKEGMLRIYSELLNISFERLSDIPVWHSDVEAYGVNDASGERIAYFFLDLYPRPNKYGHAAVWPLQLGRWQSFRDATYVTPYAGMACNFPKPTASNPSLMSHQEVETFFHEFGHVMHGVLTTARYGSQAGTSVARDFVEAPSQMLENWVWDKDMLRILSGHYQDPSKKLPDGLLKNMLRAKNHGIAYFSTRQFVLALYDFTLHIGAPKEKAVSLYHDLVKKHLKISVDKSNIFPAGFGHLSGYDAGYYGYMWSKVYSSDMFTRFKREGLLNKKTGADYRTWILEKGSSMEEMELVKGFLGRMPNEKAFLKEIGL